MKKFIRPFLTAIVLIAVVVGVLINADGSGKTDADAKRMPRIAIIQQASQSALDEGVEGYIQGLAKHGYIDGQTISVKRFNAQGDLATANNIARQATDGSYDMVITASTVSMQTVANANREGKITHLFGLVADPAGAGVGINKDPLDHPAHLAGYGVFAPVDKAIKLALQFNPRMKKVGLVWHTAESNSKAYTVAARNACAELGLELLEANAEASQDVGEAASSLVARGADALFITGDVVVLVAVDAVVAAGKRGGIPVFTVIPPNVKSGALFDLGADYIAVGTEIGELAAEVLGGRDLRTVEVVNRAPAKFALNLKTLEYLGGKWRVPAEVAAKANLLIDKDGEHVQPQSP